MSAGYVYETVQQRSRRVGVFNISCWALGVIGAMVLLYNTEELLSLLLVPLGIVIGWPVRDHGSIHRLLLNQRKGRQAARRNNGALQQPRLSQHGRKFDDIWDISVVTAAVRERDEVIELPLLTTSKRRHLTAIIKLPDGASESWLATDSDGKFDWDTRLAESVSRALAVTKEPDLYLLFGNMVRPSDRTYGYSENRRRLNSQIMAAAETAEYAESEGIDYPLDPNNPYIEGDIALGKYAMARFNMVHDQAGDTTNYLAIRLPWPKNAFGKRIKIEDPQAFMKSSLRRTMGKLLTEFINIELTAELTTTHEVNEILTKLISVRLLSTRQTYGQRDREMVESDAYADINHIDDTPGAQPDAWKPLSTTCDPDNPSYIVCDGTYIAAGYVNEVVKAGVLPGFQESATVFSDDTFYTAATLCEAKLIAPEKMKAREKERWTIVLRGLVSFNQHLTDPEGEKRLQEIIAMRGRLSDSGTRTGEFCIPFTVLANSHEELEARWEDAVTQLSTDYEINRVMFPNEIIDIIRGQVCVID